MPLLIGPVELEQKDRITALAGLQDFLDLDFLHPDRGGIQRATVDHRRYLTAGAQPAVGVLAGGFTLVYFQD